MSALAKATWASLQESGLTRDTVEKAGIKDGTSDEATRQLLTKYSIRAGYYIPYFEVSGKSLDHHRVRVLESANGAGGPKYLQPKNTGNHLYIPPGLPAGWSTDPRVPLVITEGEKKALAGAQAGLVCIGVGGVQSWRSRTIRLPGVEPTAQGRGVVVKLDDKAARMIDEQVAPELSEIHWSQRQVVIIYDSDTNQNPDVQRAAFDLACWLEDRGAEVGQFTLEPYEDGKKRGLDDFIKDDPQGASKVLEGPLTWPLPPSPRSWVADQLDTSRVSRLIQRRVARVSLAYLDQYGARYKDAGGTYYFFDYETKILHPFRLDNLNQLRSSSFGALLTNELGVQTADQSTMSRLADLFATREPVSIVTPHRAVTTLGDVMYYQLGDGRVAKVDADNVTFVDNGTDGVLFLPDVVDSIDEDALAEAIGKHKFTTPLWLNGLRSVNLQPFPNMTIEQTQELLCTLFYLSPWLNRWRRLMLPLEVAVAEPNSGKTFLYNLRRGILTGRPDLEGLPDDFRGWVSSVSAAPALWVCDNLGGVRSDFWHRLNDELARLITDPNPTIELRQLYTTASVYHVPVNTAFAVTTIKNPFTAPDILQRSLIFHLAAIPINRRDSSWYHSQLQDRTNWVAEHLLAVQGFFRQVDLDWNDHYLSGFRLVHFEQALLMMGKTLGFDMAGIVRALPAMVSSNVAEYDPVVEALVEFVREWTKPNATAGQVVDWVQMDPERRFVNIKTFDNSILLGRYFNSHTYDVEQATGIQIKRQHNQTMLRMPEVVLDAS